MSTQDLLDNPNAEEENDNSFQQDEADEHLSDLNMSGHSSSQPISNAPTAASDDSDPWVAILRQHVPPSSARNILRNTSLDPTVFNNMLRDVRQPNDPASRPSPAQARAAAGRQRRHDAARQREERLEAEAEEQEEEERRREARRKAEEVCDMLRQHYRKLEPLEATWESALRRFHGDDPRGWAAFMVHACHASTVNKSPVRFFDHLRWYRHLPRHVRLALDAIAHYYHNECSIRVKLNVRERSAGSWGGRLREEEEVGAVYGLFPRDEGGNEIVHDYAQGGNHQDGIPDPDAIPPDMDTRGYGLETLAQDHIRTICDFGPVPDFSGQREEATLLRAAFELRKVRLEHEPSNQLRFPATRPFRHSLDHSVLLFIQNIVVLYADVGKSPKKRISNELAAILRRIHEYGERINHRRIKIQRLPSLIAGMQECALELEALTADPSTAENELPRIQEQVEETVRQLEHLQDEWANANEDTVAKNPYDSNSTRPERPVTGVFTPGATV